MPCTAPPGYYCNGSSYVFARLDWQPLERGESGGARHLELKRLEVGGCCCDFCTLQCASSLLYQCDSCTGAATPECASCYWYSKTYYASNGVCFDPPPSPPRSPAPLPLPPSPPGLSQHVSDTQSPVPSVMIEGRPPASPSAPLSATFTHVGSNRAGDDMLRPPYERDDSRALLPFMLSLPALLGIIACCAGMRGVRVWFLRRWLRRQPEGVFGSQALSSPTDARDGRKDEVWSHLPTRIVGCATGAEAGGGGNVAGGDVTGGDVAHECAICLSDLLPGEEATQLPCGHEYHSPCIRTWFISHTPAVCPLCKVRAASK